MTKALVSIIKSLIYYFKIGHSRQPQAATDPTMQLRGLINYMTPPPIYLVDAVKSSGILKAKQKLGRTFNSDKLGGIDFTKFSKMTMCRASEANS